MLGTDDASVFREDDANWPKKNIVGKQELEIRVGNDHIAFEVRATAAFSKFCNSMLLFPTDR